MRTTTRRDLNTSKSLFLDELMMAFGDKSMSVCYNYKKDGLLCYSKWIKWWYLMHLGDDMIVHGLPFMMTKQQFISLISHRSILDVEILIDIDDPKMLRFDIWDINTHRYRIVHLLEYDSIPSKALSIMSQLSKPYSCYWTQNKSFHISIICSWLRQLPIEQRVKVKEQVIMAWGGDMTKKADRCMIALEDEIHYKSGQKKVLVKEQ